jgi:hypothetical protein
MYFISQEPFQPNFIPFSTDTTKTFCIILKEITTNIATRRYYTLLLLRYGQGMGKVHEGCLGTTTNYCVCSHTVMHSIYLDLFAPTPSTGYTTIHKIF